MDKEEEQEHQILDLNVSSSKNIIDTSLQFQKRIPLTSNNSGWKVQVAEHGLTVKQQLSPKRKKRYDQNVLKSYGFDNLQSGNLMGINMRAEQQINTPHSIAFSKEPARLYNM